MGAAHRRRDRRGVRRAPGRLVFPRERPEDMPFAVLLEVALQPCGWLAAYLGSALTSATDLSFRNLGGTATQYEDVTPGRGDPDDHDQDHQGLPCRRHDHPELRHDDAAAPAAWSIKARPNSASSPRRRCPSRSECGARRLMSPRPRRASTSRASPGVPRPCRGRCC